MTAIFAVATALLSGCYFVDRGILSEAIALSIDDAGNPIFGLCEPVEFNNALIEYRVGDDPWVSFWVHEGTTVSLSSGETIDADDAATSGMTGPERDANVDPGTLISITLSGSEATWQSSFVVPSGGLSVGRWVRIDNGEYDEPCP